MGSLVAFRFFQKSSSVLFQLDPFPLLPLYPRKFPGIPGEHPIDDPLLDALHLLYDNPGGNPFYISGDFPKKGSPSFSPSQRYRKSHNWFLYHLPIPGRQPPFCFGAKPTFRDRNSEPMSSAGKLTSIALVTRELKGLAEAGGVKDVAYGLAKTFSRYTQEVGVVLPFYGFLKNRFPQANPSFVLPEGNPYQLPRLEFFCDKYLGINLCMIAHPVFDKMSIYTYHHKESHLGSVGKGYTDTPEMNAILSKGFLAYLVEKGKHFDVIHGQDSHAGFLPLLAQKLPIFTDYFKNTVFLTTVHNAGGGYHFWTTQEQWNDNFDPQKEALDAWRESQGNAFFASAIYGHLNTVSPDYAREILQKPQEFSLGLGEFLVSHKKNLEGFYNGMPELGEHQSRSSSAVFPFFRTEPSYKRHKKILLNHYLRQKGKRPLEVNQPLFAFQGRLVHQKGPDILASALEDIAEEGFNNFLIQGQGDPQLMEQFRSLESKQSLVYVQDYDDKLGEMLYKACDFFIIPSRFEPCGLTDLKALISGAVPLVHRVGGLKKILDGQTGFGYPAPGCPDLGALILRALHFYENHRLELQVIQQRGIRMVYQEFNWEYRISHDYLPFLEKLLEEQNKPLT
jgi:starch synthase